MIRRIFFGAFVDRRFTEWEVIHAVNQGHPKFKPWWVTMRATMGTSAAASAIPLYTQEEIAEQYKYRAVQVL